MTRNASDPAKGLGWGAFLMGFVPGWLQYHVGQKQQAAMAFLSCTALFFVGWVVVGENLFRWALFEPDSNANDVVVTLARFGVPVTLPELLNAPANALGAVMAFDGSPTGERHWRDPQGMVHLFGWITAASGMLAAFWAAAGHWQLRLRRDAKADDTGALPRPIADPALCAGLSWLVPGLGHARAGQKDKGVVMGAAVVIVFALGMFFGAGRAVDRMEAAVWWIGQNGFGGGTLLASFFAGETPADGMPPELDLGVVLCTVAGLMNLVVMVDAFTVAERSVFPVAAAASTDAEVTA